MLCPSFITIHISRANWQVRRDSNPQHPDLESGALPIRATDLKDLFDVDIGKKGLFRSGTILSLSLYVKHVYRRTGSIF